MLAAAYRLKVDEVALHNPEELKTAIARLRGARMNTFGRRADDVGVLQGHLDAFTNGRPSVHARPGRGPQVHLSIRGAGDPGTHDGAPLLWKAPPSPATLDEPAHVFEGVGARTLRLGSGDALIFERRQEDGALRKTPLSLGDASAAQVEALISDPAWGSAPLERRELFTVRPECFQNLEGFPRIPVNQGFVAVRAGRGADVRVRSEGEPPDLKLLFTQNIAPATESDPELRRILGLPLSREVFDDLYVDALDKLSTTRWDVSTLCRIEGVKLLLDLFPPRQTRKGVISADLRLEAHYASDEAHVDFWKALPTFIAQKRFRA